MVLAKRYVVVNGFRALSDGEWAHASFLKRKDGSCGSQVAV